MQKLTRHTNILTIDVEDYFHVSAFEGVSSPCSWEKYEWRVEKNTERILQILHQHRAQATFFVLGWVAQRLPDLVRNIVGHGHEIASHGYAHQRVTTQTPDEFRRDVRRSKILLEDIIGQAVNGYRAPSFSIPPQSPWAFDALYEAGYRYDSSIFPVRHDFYGASHWPRFSTTIVRSAAGVWQPVDADATDPAQPSLIEIPVSTLSVAGKNMPIAGGGYFRLFPYAFCRWGLHRINAGEQQPFVFYLHPWEIDPDQPRMAGIGWKSRFRHYLNLHRTEERLNSLLDDFSFTSIRHNLTGTTATQPLVASQVRPWPAKRLAPTASSIIG